MTINLRLSDAVPLKGLAEYASRNPHYAGRGTLGENVFDRMFTICHTTAAMAIGLSMAYGFQKGVYALTEVAINKFM